MEDQEQKAYLKEVKQLQPKASFLKNGMIAFLVGGTICVIGQFISNMYIQYFGVTEQTVISPTNATLIFFASLFTALGFYDKLGQWAGAGALVPVTGFANAMTSASLEHKSEGMVLGIASNMFRIAGAVIVFGVVASFIVGLLRKFVTMIIS